MEKLLDFTQPLDIVLMDHVVSLMLGAGTEQERLLANRVLKEFKEHPYAWTRVDSLLEQSQQQNTKYFGLQILEEVIKYRWKALPREQCDGIKNFIVGIIIKMSQTEETLMKEKTYLAKLNLNLVHIVKQEWPDRWKSFIPDIVGSSKTSESLCQNNMEILKLLSEEIFDFSQGQMTQAKIQLLKNSFNDEFSQIFQLCFIVMENTTKIPLLYVTLETLLRFLSWIPLGYIFDTKLIEVLLYKFYPAPVFRNVALRCLNEIVILNVGNSYDDHFEGLFSGMMMQLQAMGVTNSTDIHAAYTSGTEQEKDFVQALAMFLSGILTHHLPVCERPQNREHLETGHLILAKICTVEELEIFKICLEYLIKLASDLYAEQNSGISRVSVAPLSLDDARSSFSSPRAQMYTNVLHAVRSVLISRMAKPEEVLVVEDEAGQIVREYTKDTDAIQLYKSMRECLIFLTHLDYNDMEQTMLVKLSKIMDGSDWSWNSLNTLCWAIGSISGAQSEEDEKRFLVTVIKDLLSLVDDKRGKDNKAVIASNIMYIVGQYPRFLRAHWKFLKTVVNKLFEFMHELHPGVQDMAVDTYLKIAQKCRRKFVVVQSGETEPFIQEILRTLPQIIADLQPNQIQVFYEAAGFMIGSVTDTRARDNLISKLMELPNSTWSAMMNIAATDIEALKTAESSRDISNIVRANSRLATSLGHPYVVQLGRIFIELLQVYRAYSGTISEIVARDGPRSTSTAQVRHLRLCKKEILKLLDIWIQQANDVQMVRQTFIPPLLEAILIDYQQNVPDARDSEVLSLIATIIHKVGDLMAQDMPLIFKHIFGVTLDMITKNFEDFPSVREQFFEVIRAVNNRCFQAFTLISPQDFKLVIDSIVWAMKHTASNIADMGLEILLNLLRNVEQRPETANAFYQTYLINLIREIFAVLTDTFHKSGFKLHTAVLGHIFGLVNSGAIMVPLWDVTTLPNHTGPPAAVNTQFIKDYVTGILSTAFPHVSKHQVGQFVIGLFETCADYAQFKNIIRDFLVAIREYSAGDDNAALYAEEREAATAAAEMQRLAIPGMLNPHDSRLADPDAEM